MAKRKPIAAVRPDRPRVLNYEPMILKLPQCQADIKTESTISWRTGNESAMRKAERLGVDLYQCFQTATYKIGERWYCKKHAAAIALEMLSEEP